jgi:hypothetical protein
VRQRNARWRSIPWMVKSSATLACSWTYSGELEEGRRFVEKAKRLNPNMAGLFLFQEFTSAYRQGHYAEALAVTVRMKMPGFFHALAVRAAALGQREEAEKTVQELLAPRPDFPTVVPGPWRPIPVLSLKNPQIGNSRSIPVASQPKKEGPLSGPGRIDGA